MRKVAILAKEKKKSITVTISFRSITVVALGLLTACSQAMSSDPRVFICDLPSPPFNKGKTFMVTITPGSNRVAVGQYSLYVDPLPKEKRQQGWRRWISNAGADGNANSWEELNIKTGEYRYIGINGQVESRGQCSQEK